MNKLIQWIQIGNWLSTTYRENTATDGATVAAIGGVSLPAAVAAILVTLSKVKPDLGLTSELIATITGIVGAAATQVVPIVQHWFAQRKATRAAAGVAGCAPVVEAMRAAEPKPGPVPSVITLDTEIYKYKMGEGFHFATDSVRTVRKALDNEVRYVMFSSDGAVVDLQSLPLK